MSVPTFFVSFNGFKPALFLSPGAGIGIGCWMYIVIGEPLLRMFMCSMPMLLKSVYDLVGRSAASHHSESGGGSRYNNI